MKRNRRVSKFLKEEDTDPLSVVVNLFDVAMVFAVALMVAMVMHMNMTEVFGQEDFTIVKNPGKENMEIISKEGKKINTYKPSGQKEEDSGKRGKKVGIAYELDNGEIIYVPELSETHLGHASASRSISHQTTVAHFSDFWIKQRTYHKTST